MTPSNPRRRRLTEAEWEDELARARPHNPMEHGAKGDGVADDTAAVNAAIHAANPLRTRTGRRRSWWQRGWKR